VRLRSKKAFAREEVGIPVKCNVHPWMRSYVSVFKHPYFSVSDQSGAFTIKGLPAGNYTVSAWHEKLGTLSQQLTVGPGETRPCSLPLRCGQGCRAPPHHNNGSGGSARGAAPLGQRI